MMRWVTLAAALGSLSFSLWTYFGNTLPDMKVASAYVCGKFDQLLASRGQSMSGECAEVRAIYERETGRHVQEARELLAP
jgi:hypothetical protein